MTFSRKAIPGRSRLLGCLALCIGLGSSGIAQTAPASFGNITGFAGVAGNATDSSGSPPTLATSTDIGLPSAVAMDFHGNVYFADAKQNVVWEVLQDVNNPGLLAFVSPSPAYFAGNAYAVVNVAATACVAGSPCGDGSAATAAALKLPSGLAFDTSGSVYIADTGSQAIRKVDGSSGTISTIAGDPNHQQSGYSGEGVQAQGNLLNSPTSVAVYANVLYVLETGNNIIRMIDASGAITTIAGVVPSANGTPVICTAAPCGDNGPATSATFVHVASMSADINGNIYASDAGAAAVRKFTVGGNISTVAGTLSAGAPFPDTCAPAAAPTCGDGGLATAALLGSPVSTFADINGNLYIVDSKDNAVRRVNTTNIISTIVGQLSTAGGYDGGAPGPSESARLNNPYGIAVCSNGLAVCPNGILFVSDQNNNVVRQVTPTVLLKRQVLTFTAPSPQPTYGTKPIDLSGDTSSTDYITGAATGLSASFSVTSGPGTINGSMLTITGAGPIVVTATQAGNNIYGPATPVPVTIMAAKAALTVTVSPTASLIQGNPIPATLPPQDYSITGFVNQDVSSVVTGSPSFQVTDASGGVYPVGNVPANGYYTLELGAGNLSASNYTFTFVSGTLLVTQGLAQTLTIGSFTPPAVYGDPNSTFSFSVTSSVGLFASVSATGPVRLQQITETTWLATVMGAGQINLNATQAGNLTYLTANATAMFMVKPAVLTVPLANAMRQYGAPNPPFTYGTPTGFVGTDNASVLSGAPSATTTATATSDPGMYPLTPTPGNLYAANYTFLLLPATLTITKATQQISNFTIPANVMPLSGIQSLSAMAPGGPIVYTATGAVQIVGEGFMATGAGPATITATQAGNTDYAQVSVTLSFNVSQVTQYVTAVSVSSPFGAVLPQLNWCFATFDPLTGLAACGGVNTVAADLYSGAPAVTTTASQGSPAGTYPINVAAGTLTSSVYNFVFAPGVLTISPAATYTLSVNPSSVTIPNGQSRQVTITLTPVNNYIGTVALACSGLPAGVTCTVSPANLTTVANYQGLSNPVSGTLTISANQVVAQNTTEDKSRLLAAGRLGLPGIFAGVLLFYRRRQLRQHSIFKGILILIGLGVSITCVSACGGGSSHSGAAAAGTTQIMITGSGTASAGTPLSQSVGLSVTVQ